MSTLYDLMLMLDAEAPTERREEILREVESAVSAGGSLESKHDWGPRKMAYQIEHRPDADYHLLQFTGPPSLLETLQRSLKLTDGIIRFRIIKVRPGTPPPPTPRAQQPPAEPPREHAAEPPREQVTGATPEQPPGAPPEQAPSEQVAETSPPAGEPASAA
jgi:small subunit ribosomal protein S6